MSNHSANFTNRLNPPPTIEFLKQLAQGSLRQKQTFQRAIRLWVELRSLYIDETPTLEEPFTFAEWRDQFVSSTHPRGDRIPDLHDPACPCANTGQKWLFPQTQQADPHWQKTLKQQENFDDETLAQYLQMRPFAVTRRSLQGDLHRLSQLGWLKRERNRYWRVTSPPPESMVAVEVTPTHSLRLLDPNLEETLKTLNTPLGGYPRSFLYLDYDAQQGQQDRVKEWQGLLKEAWQQVPIPPVQLTYQSAELSDAAKVTVYPVCLYYAQRSPFLCAYGETPTGKPGWYNYCLDNVGELKVGSADEDSLPDVLAQGYQQQTLPTPDQVQQALEEAWGFEFYRPKQLLLLRFDREFHDNSLQDLSRYRTFQGISLEDARSLLEKEASADQKDVLLAALKDRSANDVYYRAWYREGDSNVIQRLRSWRPSGEVLLPGALREQMQEEVSQESQLY
ncbi:TIGR03985 family CRISPR-associated protein [Spirulina sp. CS-785/01]|uniref:TIGR03985 family CRISPR-associated protein n=1 Tax=Spirulina sp. CS-785/01 TaxID=3021716 RepID=UPI00232C092C|nr:TIGR03985 family CRISPR-associated protein [Spirulina sp. CS-785/01]MDB9314363.1 TIGR03985 family CRISPR-associated protein [Spirulina sp. CS-785/01]